MATFGQTSEACCSNWSASNYLIAGKFELTEGGTVTSIKYWSGSPVNGNIKVGIYDDDGSGGDPGTLLCGPTEDTPSTSTWNEVDVPDTELSAGYYWLTFQVETQCGTECSTGGSRAYKTLSYGTAWPDPFGSLGGSDDNIVCIHAVYTPSAAAITSKRLLIGVGR